MRLFDFVNNRRMENTKGNGNQNAARKAGMSYMLTIDGKLVAGISQITARIEYADATLFPLVFQTSQGVKAFIRKAERLGNTISQAAVAVTALGSTK